MKTNLAGLLEAAARVSVALAVAAAIAVVATGGHADHPATEDYPGPVEKRTIAERQAVLLEGEDGDVLRFGTPEPLEGATPGGADPREE